MASDLDSSSPLSLPDADDSSTAAPQPPLLGHPFDFAINDQSSSVFKKNNTSALQQTAAALGGNDTTTATKKPRPRKKNEDSSANTTNAHDAETKPPKKVVPRKPRDPDAPPRKRQKKSDDASATDPQQKKLAFGLTGAASPSGNVASGSQKPPSISQVGNNEDEQKPGSIASTIHPQPRPQSSGQRYDPIRSASAENARLASSPSRPRASPSIASLIDPPSATNKAPHLATSAPQRLTDLSLPEAPSPTKTESKTLPGSVLGMSTGSNDSNLHPIAGSPAKAMVNGKSTSPSRVPSPKPARKKKEIPQLPQGNGLLSGSDFGKPGFSDRVFAEVPNQCIVIDVPITGETNNYVNFMKEVESKYGFDVAHPRLAEHRRRMAQMAAAGAAIESGPASADDMALDGSDVDSNVEIGGVDEDSSMGDGTKKKKAKRGDEYDKNDDFIDDTEQAWEEQALASKDGYFVWSGPLVTQNDKPVVERADGTVKRGGRGGRGSRGGAAKAEGSTRGRTPAAKRGAPTGGRGSRGGVTAATRKSRLTKASKEEMELEKANRLKVAAALARPTVQQGVIGV